MNVDMNVYIQTSFNMMYILHMEQYRHTQLTPSIHFHPVIQSQVAEATGPGEKPRLPSPEKHSSAPPGGCRGFPSPEGIYNSSSKSWACPGASSQLDVSRKPPKGGDQEAN